MTRRQLQFWWHLRRHRFLARVVCRAVVRWRGAPVIAVTGSNGKTTTAQLIDRLLRAGGYRVGLCTTHGVYHHGQLVDAADRSGHLGVWRAARCPGLQALVAETGRGGILRYGLAYGACRVGVVTNVLPEHLGVAGIETVAQMAAVKVAIPRCATGAVVLNADDPLVAAMARETRAAVTYFTVAGRETGFRDGWFLRAGQLWRQQAGQATAFLPVGEVPVTLGGRQRHHVANVLAALAAVAPFGIADETQRAVLRTYGRGAVDYPDRFTLTRYRGRYVLLAYCKNPDAYRLELPVIRQVQAVLGCRQLVAVVSGVGDRPAAWHEETSRQLAAVCDRVWVTPPPPEYRRGMADGEMARLLTCAFSAERVLGTTVAPVDEVLARCGAGALLWYSVPQFGRQLDVPAFLRAAEIVPLDDQFFSSSSTS